VKRNELIRRLRDGTAGTGELEAVARELAGLLGPKYVYQALVSVRSMGELVLRKVAGDNHNWGMNAPTLNPMVDRFDAQGGLPQDVRERLQCIARLGNRAAHREPGLGPADLDVALTALCELLEWPEYQAARARSRPARARRAGVLVNVPTTSQFFTGREPVLQVLRERLGPGARVALAGRSGVGKTRTAIEYALRHRDGYDWVMFAPAETEADLDAAFARIAQRVLDYTPRTRAAKTIVREVQAWLDENDDWLLILDNVTKPDTALSYVPTGANGCVLMTTVERGPVSKWARVVPVERMTEEEGVQFLLESCDLAGTPASLGDGVSDDRKAAAVLHHAADGLPLFLDRAGTYLRMSGTRPAEWLAECRHDPLMALDGLNESGPYDPPAACSGLDRCLNGAETSNPMAGDVLKLCAYLAPDNIPESFFTRCRVPLTDTIRPGIPEHEWRIAVQTARDWAGLAHNADTKALSLHRETQRAIRSRLGDSQAQWAERAARAVRHAYPHQDFGHWQCCFDLLPHQQACIQHLREHGVATAEAAMLLCQTGWVLKEKDDFGKADALYREALEMATRVHGPDHADVATILNCLGDLRREQAGDEEGPAERERLFAEAEEYCRQGLAIREVELPPDHFDLALSLNDLGLVLIYPGRHDEAEEYLARALSIFEQTYSEGPHHAGTPRHNLGLLRDAQGRFEEARELLEQAAEAFEAGMGEGPDLSRTLSILSSAYIGLGTDHYAAAVTSLVRAYDICERVLGIEHRESATRAQTLLSYADGFARKGWTDHAKTLYDRAEQVGDRLMGLGHADTAASLAVLGNTHQKLGRYAEAEPLFLRALAINRKVLAPDDPRIATSLNNLGVLYYYMGRYEEAERHQIDALERRIRALGDADLGVANSHNNLGILYYHEGRYAEAEAAYRRALEIFEGKREGEPSSSHVNTMNNLADLYTAQARYAEAEPLYAVELARREALEGPEGLDVAHSLSDHGVLHYRQGRYAEAEQALERSLAIRAKVLEADSALTGLTLYSLAELRWLQGRCADARRLYERALDIRKARLGDEHHHTATAARDLARACIAQGDCATAEPLCENALAVHQRVLRPEHPDVARSLAAMAELRRAQGDLPASEALHAQAAQVLEQALGAEHPEVIALRARRAPTGAQADPEP